jgi:hypothetical protein
VDLVPLTIVSSYPEAELICQGLEGEGIPATYLGPATASGPAVPGSGSATVNVLERDAERAGNLLRELRGF